MEEDGTMEDIKLCVCMVLILVGVCVIMAACAVVVVHVPMLAALTLGVVACVHVRAAVLGR